MNEYETKKHNALRLAETWEDLYRECSSVNLFEKEPRLRDFMLTESDEFKEYVNILMENGFKYFYERMYDFTHKSSDCECVIRLYGRTVTGDYYRTDYVRPATDNDFDYFRNIAAESFIHQSEIRKLYA